MSFEVTEKLCKYTFNEEEKKKIATTMAEQVGQLHELQEQKKSLVSDIKSKMDAVTSTITTCARKIKDGYEMKSMNCRIEKVYERQQIRFIREDNDEVVEVRPMNPDELQLKMHTPNLDKVKEASQEDNEEK